MYIQNIALVVILSLFSSHNQTTTETSTITYITDNDEMTHGDNENNNNFNSRGEIDKELIITRTF